MADAPRESGQPSQPYSVPAHPPVPPAPPAAPGGSGQVAAPVYGDLPPQAPGYVQPPASGYAPPQAPGYVHPQSQGYAPPQAPAAYPTGGYPAGSDPAAVPPRGLLPWALGLLILFPVPFLGGLLSGIAMAMSGGASRRFGGVARENARAALNWGLTYLLVSTVLIVSHFVILFTLTEDSPTGFYPIGIPITVYFALSLLHLVLVIVGMVRASSGKIMRVPFAIPYLRA